MKDLPCLFTLENKCALTGASCNGKEERDRCPFWNIAHLIQIAHPSLPGFHVKAGNIEIEFWSSETITVANNYTKAVEWLKERKE